MNIKRVLVLSAHTDDADFGAGGTIIRFIDEGREVYHIVFSSCEGSLPPGLPKDTLRRECLNSNKIMGILGDRITIFAPVFRKDWRKSKHAASITQVQPTVPFPLHRSCVQKNVADMQPLLSVKPWYARCLIDGLTSRYTEIH